MSNKIFQSILDEKIENFRLAFGQTSKELFWNEEEKKLIHPDEFGMYRESVCKDFLRLLTPRRLEIASGFLINDSEEISTQCDIIIYDAQSTALIENSDRQKFFPVETTVGIGEIKSNLSISDFRIALNKLAKNKIMREKMKTPVSIKRESLGEFSPSSYHYDSIFSFLICKKLDFNIESLCNDLNSYYDSDIKPWQRHNLILSIENGLFAYYDENDKTMMFPIHRGKELKNRYVKPDSNINCHFYYFASYFFLAMSSISIYYPEITNYIDKWTGGLNYDGI
ncbi:MAG: DUF6602 domain-containing protein [Prolixibacteraceae bacterium]